MYELRIILFSTSPTNPMNVIKPFNIHSLGINELREYEKESGHKTRNEEGD